MAVRPDVKLVLARVTLIITVYVMISPVPSHLLAPSCRSCAKTSRI